MEFVTHLLLWMPALMRHPLFVADTVCGWKNEGKSLKFYNSVHGKKKTYFGENGK